MSIDLGDCHEKGQQGMLAGGPGLFPGQYKVFLIYFICISYSNTWQDTFNLTFSLDTYAQT